jgi:hypothetical protein
VALSTAAGLLLGLGSGVGGAGNTHVVLQLDAWELQDIMQLVVVEVIGVESPGVGLTTFGVVCARAELLAAAVAPTRMITKVLIIASLSPKPRLS